eukprot:CAMPEP_0177608348 /NCGR_PEP_ID=MMETSP0419_2-20121207/18423_1 /TAXON_ID=582737 /ORGANISM="Tetraselmis sp., Strain GSL018" /LENGTH=435 /DNA_ID=CAMNT_0019103031 /DNA_START=95 /DNA_END=1399 /DNA_ORIENTATION=-
MNFRLVLNAKRPGNVKFKRVNHLNQSTAVALLLLISVTLYTTRPKAWLGKYETQFEPEIRSHRWRSKLQPTQDQQTKSSPVYCGENASKALSGRSASKSCRDKSKNLFEHGEAPVSKAEARYGLQGSRQDSSGRVRKQGRLPNLHTGAAYSRCPGNISRHHPKLDGLSVRLPDPWSDIFITQENHRQLLRDEFAISPSSVRLLPASSGALKSRRKWGSCAAVGSSGSLRSATFGDSIDSHDVVLRINQAPTFRYEALVGSKTNLRILNKLWTLNYAAGRFKSMALPLERGVTLIITRSTGKEFDRLAGFLQNYRPDVEVLYLSSRFVTGLVRKLLLSYRSRLCQSGRGPYPGGTVPSSGLVAVLMFAHLCRNVTVYGMGPRADGGSAPYHYFVGNGARHAGTPVHSWGAEEMLLRQLAAEGGIELCRAGRGRGGA